MSFSPSLTAKSEDGLFKHDDPVYPFVSDVIINPFCVSISARKYPLSAIILDLLTWIGTSDLTIFDTS